MSDNTQLTAKAVVFQPGMEHEEANESVVDVDADTILKGIRENTYKNSGHARRTLHAKSHGIVLGTLSVLRNLPPVLAQGLFSKPADYKAVMRFSTLPG